MELLTQKIKLGIIKACSVEPLLACEDAQRDKNTEMSEVVLEAFQEYAVREFDQLPRADELSVRTKLTVIEKRVEMLERRAREYRETRKGARDGHLYKNHHVTLFRQCPQQCEKYDDDDRSAEAMYENE